MTKMKRKEPQWLSSTMKRELETALRTFPELCERFKELDDYFNVLATSSSGYEERVSSTPKGISPQERAVMLKERHEKHRRLEAVVLGICNGLEALTARQREFVRVVYEEHDYLPIREAVEMLGFDGVVREKKYYELRDRVLCRLAPYVLEPYRRFAYSQCFSKFGWKKIGDYLTERKAL